MVSKTTSYAVIALITVTAVLVLLVRNPYFQHLLILLFVFMISAQCWNLVAGFGNLISLGQQLFFGIGGYMMAISMVIFGLPAILAVFLAGLLAALSGMIIVHIFGRLTGAAFAVVTWMFAEAAIVIITNLKSTFPELGGDIGMYFPLSTALSKEVYLYTTFALALFVNWLVYRIDKSKLGTGLKSIRQDAIAANMCGVDVERIKLLVFTISATLTGIAGGLYSAYMMNVRPYDVFSFTWMVKVVTINVLGGLGTAVGPLLGAPLYFFPMEYLSYTYGGINIILQGVFLAITLIFLRGGIWRRIENLKKMIQKIA